MGWGAEEGRAQIEKIDFMHICVYVYTMYIYIHVIIYILENST